MKSVELPLTNAVAAIIHVIAFQCCCMLECIFIHSLHCNSQRSDVLMQVQDLHTITPACFVEASGSNIHALSYQQARNSRLAVGQASYSVIPIITLSLHHYTIIALSLLISPDSFSERHLCPIDTTLMLRRVHSLRSSPSLSCQTKSCSQVRCVQSWVHPCKSSCLDIEEIEQYILQCT